MKRDELPSLEVELLQQILIELRELNGKNGASGKFTRSPSGGDLLKAVFRAIGSKSFTASESIILCQHPAASALQEAILSDVGALSARSLGKRLQHLEGHPIDGLVVLRNGADSAGTIWRVMDVAESKLMPVA